MKEIFKNKELLKKIGEFMNTIKEDKKKDLKLSALIHLMEVNRPYDNEFFSEEFYIGTYSKKMDFILKASTKKEIEDILNVSQIYYGAGEIVSKKYNIPEEELMMWSITSLKAPLNHIGFERYMKVFKEYFGEEKVKMLGM